MSVTLMHPAKAVGQNDMSFGRKHWCGPSNTVLDGGPSPHGKGDLGIGHPNRRNQVAPMVSWLQPPYYEVGIANVFHHHHHPRI